MIIVQLSLEVYLVQSQDGKYLRSKGLWVNDAKDAKVFLKLSQARTQVTWWATQYPQYGIPNLIILRIDEGEVKDETPRVLKSIAKKDKANLRQEAKQLEWKTQKLNKDLEDLNHRRAALGIPPIPLH
jgi:hypothetical protein